MPPQGNPAAALHFVFSLCAIIRASPVKKSRKFTLSEKAAGMRQIEGACKKCDFCARNLIIKKCSPLCHPAWSGAATHCHPERSEAESKDLYDNNDDIRIEIPRQARDDRGLSRQARDDSCASLLRVTLSGAAAQPPRSNRRRES